MRKHDSENVIASGSVELGDGINAREISGTGEADAGGSSVELFLGNANRRIVFERGFDGGRKGEWAVGGNSEPGKKAEKQQNRRIKGVFCEAESEDVANKVSFCASKPKSDRCLHGILSPLRLARQSL